MKLRTMFKIGKIPPATWSKGKKIQFQNKINNNIGNNARRAELTAEPSDVYRFPVLDCRLLVINDYSAILPER